MLFAASCKKAGKRSEELSAQLQPVAKPYVLLSGRVVEPIENKIIPSARVEVIGGDKTQTDEFGVFFFKVKRGDIKLKIEKEGFAPTYRILKSVEDDTRIDIPLNFTFPIENKNGVLRANGFVLKTDITGENAEFTNIIKNIDSLPGDFSSPTFNSFGFFKIKNYKNHNSSLIMKVPNFGKQSIPLFYFDENDFTWKQSPNNSYLYNLSNYNSLYAQLSLTDASWLSFGYPLNNTYICLEGTVVDERNNPLSFGWVIAYPVPDFSYSVRARIKNGTFNINNLPLNNYKFIVSSNGIADYRTESSFYIEKDKFQNQSGSCYNLDLVYREKYYNIKGKVVDDFENPISDATVTTSEGGVTETNQYGSFEIPAESKNLYLKVINPKNKKVTRRYLSVSNEPIIIKVRSSTVKLRGRVLVNGGGVDGISVFADGNYAKTTNSEFEIEIPKEENTEIIYILDFPDGSTEYITKNVNIKTDAEQITLQDVNFEFSNVCVKGRIRNNIEDGLLFLFLANNSPIIPDENGSFETYIARLKMEEKKLISKLVYENEIGKYFLEKQYEISATSADCISLSLTVDPDFAFIKGTVKSKNRKNIYGVKVGTNFGNITYTDITGKFALLSPVNTSVNIYSDYKGFSKVEQVKVGGKNSINYLELTIDSDDLPPKIEPMTKNKLGFIIHDDSEYVNCNVDIPNFGFNYSEKISIKDGSGELNLQINTTDIKLNCGANEKNSDVNITCSDPANNKDSVTCNVEDKRKDEQNLILGLKIIGTPQFGESITLIAILIDHENLEFVWDLSMGTKNFSDWITKSNEATAELNIPHTASGGEYILTVEAKKDDKVLDTYEKKIYISKQSDGGYVCIPSEEICDGKDNNCNGLVDENVLSVFYKDNDADGYTDGTTHVGCYTEGVHTEGISAPQGYVSSATAGDCDDNNAEINPESLEICGDGIDQNCNGMKDDLLGAQLYYKDADSDKYSDGATRYTCAPPPNFYLASELLSTQGDCNEEDPKQNPETIWYIDADADGYYGSFVTQCSSPANATYIAKIIDDCNDKNPMVFPGAQLNCNDNIDTDCDGNIEKWAYADNDGDRYIPSPVSSCINSVSFPGFITVGYEFLSTVTDCNDNDSTAFPYAPISCTDTIDNDCSGNVEKWAFTDSDGDRYAPNSTTYCLDAVSYPGYITVGLEYGTNDCDDNNASVYPGASTDSPMNLCLDGIDNDCNGYIEYMYYTDLDGDLYSPSSVSFCVNDSIYESGKTKSGLLIGTGDCDDSSVDVNPGHKEWCDGIDNDCSGTADDNIHWHYKDYSYRLTFDIYNSAPNTLTNYQEKISIDTASLINYGKMKWDCADIRFALDSTLPASCQPLSYFLESGCYSSDTKMWIKLDLPANSTSTVYMYYGSPSSNSSSNIFSTFPGSVSTKPSNLSSKIYGASCAESIGGKIYCFGGFDGSTYLNKINEYDYISENTTVKSATLPTGRSFLSCSKGENGKIYCFGGFDGNYINEIIEYSPDSDSIYVKSASLPGGRYGLSCAHGNNSKIYCFGGSDSSSFLGQIIEYDYIQDTTAVKTSTLPTPRYLLACASAQNGKIYCFGGYDGATYLNQILEYNYVNDSIVQKNSKLAPGIRELSCSNGKGGKIYCFGGFSGATATKQILEYDYYGDTLLTKADGLPSSRYGLSCAKAGDGKIYCFGGFDGSNYLTQIVEFFPDYKKGYNLVSNLPSGRYGASCEHAGNGNIYCFGGYDGAGYLSQVLEYNCFSGSGNIRPETLPSARYFSSCAKGINNKIYCFGGIDGTYLNQILEYNYITYAFSVKTATLPTGRYLLSCASGSNGKIYCFGGYDGSFLNQIVQYDPVSDSIAVMSSTLPIGRKRLSCVNAGNDRIYCFGGLDSTATFSNQIVEYDYNSDITNIKTANLPSKSHGLSCVANSNGKIYCFGGYDDSGNYLNTILEYDFVTDTTTVKQFSLPSGRYGLSCSLCGNDRIYCFGGYDGTIFLSDSLEYFWNKVVNPEPQITKKMEQAKPPLSPIFYRPSINNEKRIYGCTASPPSQILSAAFIFLIWKNRKKRKRR